VAVVDPGIAPISDRSGSDPVFLVNPAGSPDIAVDSGHADELLGLRPGAETVRGCRTARWAYILRAREYQACRCSER